MKKNKREFVDDGHTVYDMSGVAPERYQKKSDINLSKKEKGALIKAALAFYFPKLLGVLACFAAAALLLYLWLG